MSWKFAKYKSTTLHKEQTSMNKNIMNRWHQFLQSRLQDLHTYQIQALAAFSYGLAVARDCRLSEIASGVPSLAQPESIRRRLMRLLENERIDVEETCEQLAGWLVRWNRPTACLKLLLDETPLRNELRVLKVSVAYKRRALPLLWATYPLKNREEEMLHTILKLLTRVQRIIQFFAPQARVVLMADRGLCWPALIRWCQENDWDYVLRAQSESRARALRPKSVSADQEQELQEQEPQEDILDRRVTRSLGDLARKRGQWWYGRAEVFKKAGWIECNVVACWPHDAKEAWLLVTNLPPGLHLCRWYSKRNWLEQSFRDEKSHGFNWQASRVTDPKRMHRLLLIMALAHLWIMLLGDVSLSEPWRQRLGFHVRSNRRRWSLFRKGRELLDRALRYGFTVPCKLTFAPT
jgi:hypothetical protein